MQLIDIMFNAFLVNNYLLFSIWDTGTKMGAVLVSKMNMNAVKELSAEMSILWQMGYVDFQEL